MEKIDQWNMFQNNLLTVNKYKKLNMFLHNNDHELFIYKS